MTTTHELLRQARALLDRAFWRQPEVTALNALIDAHLSAGEPAAPQAAAQPVAEARVRGWHGKNVSLKTQKNGKVRLVLDLDAVEIAAAYWVTCSPAGGKCPTKKGCAAYGCHGACLDVTDYTATPGEKAALRRRIERIGLAATPPKGESTTPAAWPSGLLERVKSAEQRIRDNHAPRRIPADPTDVDLVLAEVRMLISGRETWQPIETAPKDGTSVLLFTAQGMIEGYFEHGEWEQAVCAASYDMAHAYIECKPTLWQPLPDQSPRPQSGTDGEVR